MVGKDGNGEKTDSFEDEISYALLSALLGEVKLVKEDERVVGVEFEG